MHGKLGVFFIICFTSQINQLLAGNARTVEVRLGNKTAEVQISPVDLTCQVNKLVRPTVTTVTTVTKVRADYTLTPGIGYHKFHTQAKTWNEARRVCFQEGGHLATINSKEEENVLKSMLQKNFKNIVNAPSNPDLAYVGAHSLFEANDWRTIRNEPLASVGFNGWSANCHGWGQQPDKAEERRCATISHECEGMSNHPCTKTRSFFCEISIKH